MEVGKMMNEKRILVAVDESEESMHALSWCLTNLFPQSIKTILFLLYVKPPPPVYSSIDATGTLIYIILSFSFCAFVFWLRTAYPPRTLR